MSDLLKFLPEHMKKGEQTILRGLLDAISAGDTLVLDMLSSARDQLFLNTATGLYLTNLANYYGFAVAPNSGLDSNGFRAVAIPATWSPKQSIPTINIIAELFYTAAVLHPSVESAALDPYALIDGDTLIFDTDIGSFTVVFDAAKFSDLGNISASEVISTIIGQSGGLVSGQLVVDRVTGRSKVKIISKSFGSSAKIRCRGGSAQNVLKFQDFYENVGQSPVSWTVSKYGNAVYSNTVRFTWDGVGVDPQLYSLDKGDFVTLRDLQDGAAPFSQLNGTFEILDVGADYFEFYNLPYPSSGETFVQTNVTEIGFTKQNFRTLFQNTEYAVVSETSPGIIDVNIPAVPPIVRRPLIGATRLRGETLQVLEYGINQITVNYPNLLPDSGTLIYDSVRFSLGFDRRFYRYVSKNLPIGDTQVLNLDPAAVYGLPFFDPVQAATALSVIPALNPIYGDINSEDIQVHTPPVKHNFEHAQEFTIEGANLLNAVFKQKTIPGIYLPIGQDNQYIEHDMDSNRIYAQFTDELSGEIYNLVYRPDSLDPLNRTRFYYLPELEGRFLKAVLCEISPAPAINDVTATVGPSPTTLVDGYIDFTHNFGTALTTVMGVDPSTMQNIQAIRVTDDPNNSRIYYAGNVLPQITSFNINHQDFYPNLVRVIAFNILLPASPAAENIISLTHNLFSTNLVVEVKVSDPTTTGLLPNSFLFQPKVIVPNDTTLQIQYNGTTDDIVVDVYILASFFNPIESVNGGLLSSDINDQHIVKERINSTKYSFQVTGTGFAPYGSGLITTTGKTVNGVGTSFLTETVVGNGIKMPNGQMREVAQVISDVELKLAASFTPSVVSPTVYKIVSQEDNDFQEGVAVSYEGAVIFGFNLTFNPDNARGTNLRFEFPDRVSRASAGFVDGAGVKILAGFGVDIAPALAEYIRGITLTVHSQQDRYVYFSVGLDSVPTTIIQGAKCARSGYFGGINFKHYISLPLSTINNDNWYKEPQLYLLDNNLPANEFYAGSYIYDVIGNVAPYTVGKVATTLSRPVAGLSAPGVIEVASVTGFPTEGSVFLDFGNDNFEGPIRYFLTIPGSPSFFRLDPAYIFKKYHSASATVRLATSSSKVELTTTGSQLPAYLTGSTEARKTLEKILKDLVSVGVKLRINVDIPYLQYYEPSIPPFE